MFLDNEHIIMSKRGVQQGDPLGMKLFCLSISKALEKFRSKHQLVLIIAYADDLFHVKEKIHLDACVFDVRDNLFQCGLELNSSK